MSVLRICCCIRQYPLVDDFAYSPHLSVWQCILKLIQSRSQSLRFPTDGRYTVTVFGYQIDNASVSNTVLSGRYIASNYMEKLDVGESKEFWKWVMYQNVDWPAHIAKDY